MRTEAEIETEIEALLKLLNVEEKQQAGINLAYQALLWALGGDDINRYPTQPVSEIVQGRISF